METWYYLDDKLPYCMTTPCKLYSVCGGKAPYGDSVISNSKTETEGGTVRRLRSLGCLSGCVGRRVGGDLYNFVRDLCNFLKLALF